MKIKLFMAFTVIAVLFSSFGCTESKTVNFEATYDEFMQDKDITWETTVNKGDTIIITLGSNPTTGYSWPERPDISHRLFIQQTEHEYIAPSDSSVVGASGKDVWTFNALDKGTVTIKMDYTRTWEGEEQTEWTFIATINVK